MAGPMCADCCIIYRSGYHYYEKCPKHNSDFKSKIYQATLKVMSDCPITKCIRIPFYCDVLRSC